MPDVEVDLLQISRGTVTAPAGCGKTQLIASALERHKGSKPILVLTHTNAGVVALRNRLDRAEVPRSNYRLSTIDGWAMRLISMFPAHGAYDPNILKLANPGADYLNIRKAAVRLLKSGHIADVLTANYAQLIVDEYQDCSRFQHAIVAWAAESLPTCVLGDPLQAIFGFGADGLADWNSSVCHHFPVVRALATPWRWLNAGNPELGHWLLDCRAKLLAGQSIDFSSAPSSVSFVGLDGTSEDAKRHLKAARTSPPAPSGKVLIIGRSTSPQSQREIAGQTPGAITVENVDLRDFVDFARRFSFSNSNAANKLISFAGSVMTNVGVPEFLARLQSLQQGTARKPPTEREQAALNFIAQPSPSNAAALLVEINKDGGVRAHRPAVFRACLKALEQCDQASDEQFYDAAVRIREQNRLIGRPLAPRSVGSTLLLKGLEAETCVILSAHELDAKNLYVAMTRGSHRLVVCTNNPLLPVPK